MASPRKSPSRATSKVRASAQAPQVAGEAWQAWRIADGRFDPFSAVGASLVGGRWNSPGLGVIYASRSFAGAMLECLAHAGIGRVPRTHVAVQIAVAAAVTVDQQDEANLPPGWDHADCRVARAFGDTWIRERRAAVLMVPSVVARRVLLRASSLSRMAASAAVSSRSIEVVAAESATARTMNSVVPNAAAMMRAVKPKIRSPSGDTRRTSIDALRGRTVCRTC